MKNPPALTLSPDAINFPAGLFAQVDCERTEDDCDLLHKTESTFDKEELFRGLIKEYGRSLYYFVLKRVGHPDDAEDIVQQTLVEAACGLTAYRGEAELSTWVFGIASNLARNHVTRAPQYRHQFESDLVLDGRESPDLQPCERLSQAQTLTLVSEAIDRMSPEMAHALNLVAIQDLSYKEAASKLKLPIGTLRSRVSRARAAIREHMSNAGFLLDHA
jgi:RNA polymerase sigma factor (sigma-70 family)